MTDAPVAAAADDPVLGATTAATEAVKSLAPADRQEAEAAVAAVFEALAIEPPRRMVWCDGPLAIARERELGWLERKAGSSLLPALNEALLRTSFTLADGVYRDPLWRRRDLFLAPFHDLRQSVIALVDQDAARHVRTFRLRRLAAGILGTRRPQPWPSIGTSAVTQFDAVHLSTQHRLYGRHGCRPDHAAVMRGVLRIAAACGWFAPHHDACWLGERPLILRLDDRLRLHAADGPALVYRDGWTVHAWKGVRMPARHIEEPRSISVSTVNRAADPFVRRCLIDIMTPERFIANGGATIVARDEAGTLWQRRWLSDAWAAVEVVNGTPERDGTFKHYFLQVPPDMTTARQAVAWTYGLSESQYARLSLRT